MVRHLAKRLRRSGFNLRRFTILANTPDEVPLFLAAGFNATWCNHNAFVSEHIFRPMGTPRQFDAIYDAAFAPFKRHELAANVESLALVGYVKAPDTEEVARAVRNRVPQATVLNDPFSGRDGTFSSDQVNEALNQARVGLCLSAIEGQMYASVQYLLAGLPIVTTENRGGRDVFFDAEHVRWVEDDPDAVSAAVDRLVRDDIDPKDIRKSVLVKMKEHRARFCEVVRQLAGDEGRPWSQGWPSNAPNKLMSPELPSLSTFFRLATGLQLRS